MRLRRVLQFAFVALLGSVAMMADSETIYRHVDRYGNVTYSDEPPATGGAAEEIKLKPVNTAPPVEVRATPDPTPELEAVSEPEPYNLRIADPKDGQQIGPAIQIVSVLLLTDRNLDDGLLFQLSIDGKPYEEPTRSNNININVRRSLQGRRLLTAAIVDGNGTVIESTQAITVQVIRPPIQPRAVPH